MSTYTITITSGGATAPRDGFIDPKTVYQYMNASADDAPDNYAASLAKVRGNRRHKAVILSVQFYSGLQITKVETTGSPSSDVAPDSIVYTVEYPDIAQVTTKDEANAGAILTGIPAVKRIVARALIRTETLMLEVYDPTKGVAPGNTSPAVRTGPRMNIETVGPVHNSLAAAEATISVALT